jgi:LPS sulfotransferase NodH
MLSRPEHRQLFESVLSNKQETFENANSLMILASPRCGSTFFCDVLNKTGRLGLCDEWINIEYFQAYCVVLGIAFADFKIVKYLKTVIGKTLRGTGVFVIKSHIGQLDSLATDFGIRSMSFGKTVYLYRKDKIAQAVSYAKAKKTNQWRFDQTPDEKDFELTYDDIAASLAALINTDSTYKAFYSSGVAAELAYEDFCNLAHPCYNEIITSFNKPRVDIRELCSDLRIQRGKKSEEYVCDFRRYLTGEY